MGKLSVKVRLAFSIGVMMVMMAVVAAFALVEIGNANERLETYVNGINARAELALAVRGAVNRRAIAARNLVLVKRPQDLAEEKAAVMEAHGDVGEQLSKLKEAVAAPGIPGVVRAKVAEIEDVERRYGPVATHIVELALVGKRDAAIASMNDDCRPLLKALSAAVNAYHSLTHDRAMEMLAAD